MSERPARGQRLVGYGWLAATVLVLTAVAFAGDVEGRFAHGQVRVRPWMQSYNLALGILHFIALGLLAAGALRARTGGAQKLAVFAFVLACATVVAMLIAPLWLGAGPWAPDAPQVRIMRVLTFAPSALRTLGCAALAVALFGSRTATSLIVALLSADLLLVSWKWAVTPKAVMTCVHPFCATPVGLVPWLLATVVFLWALGRPTVRA